MSHPSRPLRVVPPHSTWEVTLRTLQSRLLMPPTPACRDRILGILGRALKRHPGIELHAFIFLNNHFHLLLTAKDGDSLAGFMCFLNSNVARKIGKLVGWRSRFWGRRYRAIQILDDDAMVERLRYLLSQGVKEGLVASPQSWPGASSTRALCLGEAIVGTWVDETSEFLAKRRGDKVRAGEFATKIAVLLRPLPCWRALSERERRRRIRDMIRSIESEAPRRVSGPEKAIQQPVGKLPRTTSRTKCPPCHASTLEQWKAFKDEYRTLRDQYVTISRRIRAGDCAAVNLLPPHFFPPRMYGRVLLRMASLAR